MSERLGIILNKKGHFWDLIPFVINKAEKQEVVNNVDNNKNNNNKNNNSKVVSKFFGFYNAVVLNKNYSVKTVLYRKSNYKQKIVLSKKEDCTTLTKVYGKKTYTVSSNQFMTSFYVNDVEFIDYFDSEQLRINSDKFNDIEEIKNNLNQFKDLINFFEEQSNLLEDFLHCELDVEKFEMFIIGKLKESSYKTKSNWLYIKDSVLSFPNLFGYLNMSKIEEFETEEEMEEKRNVIDLKKVKKDFEIFPFETYESIKTQSYDKDCDFKANFAIYGEYIKMHNYYVRFEYWSPRRDHFGYHGERNAYRRLTLKFFKKKGLNVEILGNSNQKDIKSDFFIELEHDGIKTIKTNSNSKELTNKEILEILADSLKLLKKYDEKTEKFFE